MQLMLCQMNKREFSNMHLRCRLKANLNEKVELFEEVERLARENINLHQELDLYKEKFGSLKGGISSKKDEGGNGEDEDKDESEGGHGGAENSSETEAQKGEFVERFGKNSTDGAGSGRSINSKGEVVKRFRKNFTDGAGSGRIINSKEKQTVLYKDKREFGERRVLTLLPTPMFDLDFIRV